MSEKPASGLSALARFGELDDRQLKRMIIQQLLADQFRPTLVNDARFQQVVSRVTEAVDEEPASAALLNEVLADVRRR